MKVRMLAGARIGQEQEVPVLTARTLVSDGRAEYVDAWRNPVAPAAVPSIAAESNPPAIHKKERRGRK